MSCIGTAGHVDHGKSTLVKALTGIDPDRLAEEKERGMTIDLGFAWLPLPSGREVSIVDVPGHEHFIKNMLAGIGGIDAALLVIAADEGIMPQTREHLAILDLLHIPRGVVALTKADLVDDEWLALVQEEVTELLQPTMLAQAPIIPVSAHTGLGLPDLLDKLDRMLDQSQAPLNNARPRLPVDRVFTLTGFGTIVTGTLLDGTLHVGQEVVILPQDIKSRIRTIQMHKRQVEQAQPGSRVALNLPNVARNELARGNVVSLPGQQHTSMLCDVRLSLLTGATHPLKHNARVDFYNGSQEIPARVRLLDTENLLPGKSTWAQLRLDQPAVLTRRDRFILRIPSPSATTGGGEILDVHPRYHRRFQPAVLADLERLTHDTPAELVLAALDLRRETSKGTPTLIGYELEELARRCNLAEDVTRETLKTLLSEGRVHNAGSFWFAQPVWETLAKNAVDIVQSYHQQYPLRSGISKEEWRTRLHLTPKLATEIFQMLQANGQLAMVLPPETLPGGGDITARMSSSLIRLAGFVPVFTPAQQQQVTIVLQHFQEQPYTPPGRTEVEAMIGSELLTALIEQGHLIKVGEGLLFLRESYEDAIKRLLAYLREHGSMTAAEARDVLGTTRKYILPLLEQLDMARITQRQGDVRKIGPNASTIA